MIDEDKLKCPFCGGTDLYNYLKFAEVQKGNSKIVFDYECNDCATQFAAAWEYMLIDSPDIEIRHAGYVETDQ